MWIQKENYRGIHLSSCDGTISYTITPYRNGKGTPHEVGTIHTAVPFLCVCSSCDSASRSRFSYNFHSAPTRHMRPSMYKSPIFLLKILSIPAYVEKLLVHFLFIEKFSVL